EVLDIIQQAMEPDRERRFATANAMRQAIDEHLGDRAEGSKPAISAYVQRAFVEERRKFYQSARAAENRLDQSAPPPPPKAPAPLSEPDSVTMVRVSSPPNFLEPQDEPTEPSAGSLVNTSFAQRRWRRGRSVQLAARRTPVVLLALGGGALLAAGWALAKILSTTPVATVAAPPVSQPAASPSAPPVPVHRPETPAIASSS